MEKFKRFLPRFKSRTRHIVTEDDGSTDGTESVVAPGSVKSSSTKSKPASPRPAHVYEEEPHGLFVLHPPPEIGADPKGFQVDIVAVHGLNGTARATWRDAASGKFWLQDFLPLTMPNARVMTYGYDSGLAFSRSTAGIENFARDLLNRLRMMRTSQHEKNRPLIFVAHSLGGIVVKKALILASEAKPVYGHVLTSTVGIVFMGTPHQGSDLVPWAMMVSHIANVAFVGQAVRTDLIAALKTGSPILADISGAFVPHSKPLKIMSFVETQIERPLPALVVPEHSARMNLPNEIVFPVNANHRSICRYPSVRNQTYVLVEGAIKEVVASVDGAPRTDFEIASRDPPPPRTTSAQSAPVMSHTTPVNPASSSAPDLNANEETANMVFVRVNGLIRHLLSSKVLASKDAPRPFSTILQIPADTPIDNLKSHILQTEKDAMPNFEYFRWPGAGYSNFGRWVDVFTAAATVTSGRPCYDAAQGYKIHREQTIASFFSKAFPSPVQVQLHRRVSYQEETPTSSYAIAFGQRGTTDGQISLLRSVRVPEDGNRFDVPQSLGTLPVYDVRSFSGDLPVSVAAKGGIFVAMHDEEAMLLSFDSLPTRKYAIRPFLGGVNGISGISMFETAAAGPSRKQDYVVVPDQERLDGIAASPGQVRQFVATPSANQPKESAPTNRLKRKSRFLDFSSSSDKIAPTTGASLESQMTGEDKMGGIQLQIIPQYDIKNMHAGSVENVILNDDDSDESYDEDFLENDLYRKPRAIDESAVRFDVLKTPQELGFQDGAVIHIKDLNARMHSRKRVLRDLFDDPKAQMVADGILDLEIDDYSSQGNVTINIREKGSRTSQKFTFEFDDEIKDINTYLQMTLKVEGSLQIAFPVENDLEFCAEVKSWQDISMFGSAKSLLVVAANTLRSIRAAQLDALDFVFGPVPQGQPRRICCFSNREEGQSASTRTLLALPLDAVALDLCREVEARDPVLTPLRLFLREGARGHQIRGPEPLFGKASPGVMPVFEPLHSSESMKLHVKTMTGQTVDITAASENTLDDLKMIWQDRTGVPPSLQRFIYGGRQLEEGSTLGDYNIGPGAYLHLVLRLRGGGPRAYFLGLGLKVSVGITEYADIAQAKETFSEESGIDPSRLIITFKGVEMPDYATLDGYMEKSFYVTLRPQNPQLLAIGAGGTIAQTIKPDPTDKRCWDLANSKIVNIQILNASEFKTLTGHEAPSTPIRASKPVPAERFSLRPQVMDVPSAEGAFDAIQGVDAWRRKEEDPELDADADVRGYAENGRRIDSESSFVVTMDVDDAFSGLSI